MMEYDFVKPHTIGHEIYNLVSEHISDAPYDGVDVDFVYYVNASKAGQCYAATARAEGELIGYAIFMVAEDVHKKGSIEANSSALFIKRGYRGQVASEIIRAAEAGLRALGIKKINYLLADDRIGKLLERKGYEMTHKQWSSTNE